VLGGRVDLIAAEPRGARLIVRLPLPQVAAAAAPAVEGAAP
jgi:hypothetical protein